MRAVDAEENKRNQAQFIDMICHEIRYPPQVFFVLCCNTFLVFVLCYWSYLGKTFSFILAEIR